MLPNYDKVNEYLAELWCIFTVGWNLELQGYTNTMCCPRENITGAIRVVGGGGFVVTTAVVIVVADAAFAIIAGVAVAAFVAATLHAPAVLVGVGGVGGTVEAVLRLTLLLLLLLLPTTVALLSSTILPSSCFC